MSYTEPAYGLPYTIAASETVTVTFSAGASSTVVAALTEGTYYTGPAAAGSLLDQVSTDIATQDAITNVGSTWDAVADWPATLSHRSLLGRNGLAGDLMATMVFSSASTAQALGYATTMTTSNGIVSIAPDAAVASPYQRGHLWLPRQPLTKEWTSAKGLRVTATTNSGSSVSDGYGRYLRYRHVHEFIFGASVYLDKSALTEYAAKVPGMDVADPNVALQAFWNELQDYSGAAPVARYFPDSSSMGTYTAMVLIDSRWDDSFDGETPGDGGPIREMTPAPLMYAVEIRGIESV